MLTEQDKETLFKVINQYEELCCEINDGDIQADWDQHNLSESVYQTLQLLIELGSAKKSIGI